VWSDDRFGLSVVLRLAEKRAKIDCLSVRRWSSRMSNGFGRRWFGLLRT
jgi:hypothetical protein